MAKLRLIAWNDADAERGAAALRALGHDVDATRLQSGADLKGVRAAPPDAVVIDLGRLPSHGRDVAAALRLSKATRHVPLVFVGGAADKVARVRDLLPDAAFTTWEAAARDLPGALAHPPAAPVVPASGLAGYSGTPLPKKLGIGPGATVALRDAPDGFEETLGELPSGARVVRAASGAAPPDPAAVTVWFVRSRAALDAGLPAALAAAGTGALWIAWPKKTAALASDLAEPLVRERGLAEGWVDSKVAAIDETWSGLRFTRRRR